MSSLTGLEVLAENVTTMNDLGMDFTMAPEFTDSNTFTVIETNFLLE